MSDYRDLKVWRKSRVFSRTLVKAVNERKAPEHTDLRRQIIRSCISIRSNIAEGSGKHSGKEFVRFLRISVGSCNEVEDQLTSSADFDYLPTPFVEKLLQDVSEIRRMLYGLIKYLESRDSEE